MKEPKRIREPLALILMSYRKIRDLKSISDFQKLRLNHQQKKVNIKLRNNKL